MTPKNDGQDRVPGTQAGSWFLKRARVGPAPFLEAGAWLIGGFYALAAVTQALGEGGGHPLLVAVPAVSSVLVAAVAVGAHTIEKAETRVAMVSGVAALVVANGIVEILVGAGPERATQLGLAIVVVGAFVEARLYLSLVGAAALAWGAAWPRLGGAALHGHYTAFLVAAAVLGFVLVVVHGYRRQELALARTVEDGLTEDLRLTLGWYKKLFHESPALMCVHDADGRIEEVNPAGLGALGYARQDVVGRNIMEFMLPVTEDGPEKYLRDIQRLGWTEGLLRARRSDGSLRIWEYRSTIIQSGPQVQVLATAADITELAEARDWVPNEPDPRLK